MKKYMPCLILLATLILTVISFKAAYVQRGYYAVGGEALVPILGIYIAYTWWYDHRRKPKEKYNIKKLK